MSALFFPFLSIVPVMCLRLKEEELRYESGRERTEEETGLRRETGRDRTEAETGRGRAETKHRKRED